MRLPKSSDFPIRLFGYVILAFGVSSMAVYYIGEFLYSLPRNMGIVLGNGALTLLGCVTLAVADSLKKFERRLEQLERTKDRQ